MSLLGGKAIVVTGAGRGLGAAYAHQLASEGAAIVVNDIDPDTAGEVTREIERRGGRASMWVADVSCWDAAKALVDHCVDRFGCIDGLVNNAGYFSMSTPDATSETELRQNLSINVLGTAFCGAHAIPHMMARRSGAIVNDTSGAQFGMKNRSAYAAAKGAVASLTYTWALELEEYGIRVNAISPRARTRMSEIGREFRAMTGAADASVSRRAPSPDAVSPLVTFLLSDKASGVTGQIIRHEGDRLALLAHPAVMSPVLERDAWSVDDITQAFEQTLHSHMAPLGLVVVEPNYVIGTDSQ